MTTLRWIASAGIAAIFAAVAGNNAYAQFHTGVEKLPEREVKAQAIDEGTYRRLERIYEQIGEEQWQEAYQGLTDLRERVSRSSFETAQVDQLLGHVHMAREEFDQAIAAFERAIEADQLPNQTHFDMMFSVAQLHFQEENYEPAFEALRRWVAHVDEPRIEAWVIVGTIYLERGEYQRALDNMNYAIDLYRERNPEKEPPQNWFQSKLYAHFELEEYPQAAEVLEYLVRRDPENKQFWIQLSQLYMQMEREERALGILALAHRQGYLDRETHLLQLSNLYSIKGVPYKAAKILEAGLEEGIVESNRRHWEQLANSWGAARELEEAVAAYERAGSYSDDGQLDLQRAFMLYDMDRFQDAADAASMAISKGDLRRAGEAYMLVGTAHFEMENWDEALAAMQEARQFDRQRSSASQWIRYINDARNK